MNRLNCPTRVSDFSGSSGPGWGIPAQERTPCPTAVVPTILGVNEDSEEEVVQRDFADQVKDLDVGRLLWPLWVSLCSYECLYKRKTGSDECQRRKQRSE